MAEAQEIRIFLVDDHAVVRQGTREILNHAPGLMVVGESASGEELAGLLRLKAPDVLLLDINLPGKNGLQLLSELRPLFPALKILLFSAFEELPYVRKAQALQADGFLSKSADAGELEAAIRNAMQPESGFLLSTGLQTKLENAATPEATHPLTAREREILAYLAQGLTNQAIAKALCLSVKTVDTHVASLIKKSRVNNRTQLLAHAYHHGLV